MELFLISQKQNENKPFSTETVHIFSAPTSGSILPRRGGAVLLGQKHQFLMLLGCLFSDNTAAESGGAIHVEGVENSVIDSCVFASNTAREGGAVYVFNSSLVVQNCTLIANTGSISSGAFHFNQTSVNISHSELSSNVGLKAGALFFTGKLCTLHISNCKIARNNFEVNFPLHTQLLQGSAVSILSAREVFTSGTIFSENQDAALMLGGTTAWIQNCSFDRNCGSEAGAIVGRPFLVLTIANSLFKDNSGSLGGVTLSLENKVTILQDTHISLNISVGPSASFPVAIGISAQEVDFRSCGNVFSLPPSRVSPYDQSVFLISSGSKNTISAQLYFWKTYFQSTHNKSRSIDRTSLHNVTTLAHVKLTAEFSKFASGKTNKYKELCFSH